MPAIAARTVVEWAMQIEANGEAFYKAAAATATHRDAKLILEDLAYQEDRHYHVFQRMLDRLPSAEGVETGRQEAEAYLHSVLSHALVGADDKGMELARQAASEEDALKAAMAFEKDTLLFFYDVLESVPAEQRKAVEAVIAEEKRHLQELAAALEQGLWVG